MTDETRSPDAYDAVCSNSQGSCGWTRTFKTFPEAWAAEVEHRTKCYDPENACSHPSGCFCEACDD